MNITTVRGAVDQEMIAEGLNAQGQSVVYFADPQVGPMVLGGSGPQIIGQGVRDLWDSVNLAATTKVGQVVFYSAKGEKGQVWWWWATGSNNEPNVLAIYDVATSGWSVGDTGGRVRLARAAVIFARTLGASMSRDLVPYVSDQGFNNRLLRCDTTDTDDNGTAFQATLRSRPYILNELNPVGLGTPYVIAEAASGVSLTVKFVLDFGRVERSGTIDLTASGSETHVVKRVEALQSGDRASIIQVEVGDASAVASAWKLRRVYVPVAREEGQP